MRKCEYIKNICRLQEGMYTECSGKNTMSVVHTKSVCLVITKDVKHLETAPCTAACNPQFEQSKCLIKARNSQSVANAFDFWRQKKSNISANYLTTTEDLMSAAAAAR
jgi:hypothetical protein